MSESTSYKTQYTGKPVSRVDGHAKVTGGAKYAAEFNNPDLLYGYVVSSGIPRGEIKSIDDTKALAVKGVVKVFTHENAPSLARFDRSYKDQDATGGSPFRPLHDNKVLYNMQPIALVVADTFETARYAASLIEVSYESDGESVTNLSENLKDSYKAPKGKTGYKPPPSRGDADKAFAAAPYKIEAEYVHGAEHHNPMEMHASTVIWEGKDKLTVYDKTQGVTNSQGYITKIFGLSKKDVRVMSPFVGGGFGSGLRPQYQLFLATLAALELQRSVKVVLTRQQMFSFGHRPKNIQRLALSANEEGLLQSVAHKTYQETSQFEDYTEMVSHWSGLMYQCENTKLEYELVKLDVYTPLDMRAPGAASAFPALESAIDELAYQMKMDPLEFRKKNYAVEDQNAGKPFSSKELAACYDQGAERFGWKDRPIEPRSLRDGNHLVGWGMSSGCWDAAMQKCGAKAHLSPSGKVVVTCGTSDIGTGTYTIMTQIAAETLGLPIENIIFQLGDTNMPEAPLQGGSWTAASAGSAVKDACQKLTEEIFKLAKKMDGSPFADVEFSAVVFRDGFMVLPGDQPRSISIETVLQTAKAPIEAEGAAMPNLANMMKYAFYAHSATFVEVKVDEDLGTIHVTRVVSAIAGGRILNPKTARSQILGAVVWGIGMALMEDSVMDHHNGRFMNHNYAEYHIPVNADIHDIDVIFVEENDDIVNPLGVKGLGEIGIVGVAGAIANAVFHATGKRVRRLPIQVQDVL